MTLDALIPDPSRKRTRWEWETLAGQAFSGNHPFYLSHQHTGEPLICVCLSNLHHQVTELLPSRQKNIYQGAIAKRCRESGGSPPGMKTA